MGMSVNLSENGVFVATNRNFAVESPVDLELLLPGETTTFLEGVIKRTSKAGSSSLKSGIGIQIVRNDQHFVDFIAARNERKSFKTDCQTGAKTFDLSISYASRDMMANSCIEPEKRQHKRVSIARGAITTGIAATTRALILNISKSGMLVQSEGRLTVGSTYPVKIHYQDETLSMTARAMWALMAEGIKDSRGLHIPVYLTGMQFHEGADKIESLLVVAEADAAVTPMHTRTPLRTLSEGACRDRSNPEASDCQPQNSYGLSSKASEKEMPQENTKNRRSARKYFERGKLEFWNGNFTRAAHLFEYAISHDNSSGKYFSFYAQTLAKLGKLHGAEQAIREALSIDPTNADYLVEAGNIHYALGFHGRAKENFEMALNFQPSHVKAHRALFRLKSSTDGTHILNNNPMRTFKRIIER